ncbi:hypothetical protein Gogos_000709, partial [Gossypium gossypioides]|nr:hypothetical protein [Gossypium gossypioides]
TPNRIGVPIITEIFEASNAERILCILLSDSSQEDDVVWQAKCSGEYTVRSGYRLLNTDSMKTTPNVDDRTIYKKMEHSATPICPRCQAEPETVSHVITTSGPAQELPKCTPPRDPYVKINFDAAFKEQERQSRSDSVIRDSEALACVQALKFAREMGFTMIEVEGDSRTVISNINGAKEDKSHNSAYISDARTQGFALREDTYWVEEVPTVALTAVATDRRWVDPPWLTFWLEIVL